MNVRLFRYKWPDELDPDSQDKFLNVDFLAKYHIKASNSKTIRLDPDFFSPNNFYYR